MKKATTAKRTSKDLEPQKDTDVKGGDGKVQVHDISVTKYVDKSSPVLFL